MLIYKIIKPLNEALNFSIITHNIKTEINVIVSTYALKHKNNRFTSFKKINDIKF